MNVHYMPWISGNRQHCVHSDADGRRDHLTHIFNTA